MTARSFTVIRGPSKLERTIISPTSSGLLNWARVRMLCSLVYDSKVPPDRRMLRAMMACMISPSETW